MAALRLLSVATLDPRHAMACVHVLSENLLSSVYVSIAQEKHIFSLLGVINERGFVLACVAVAACCRPTLLRWIAPRPSKLTGRLQISCLLLTRDAPHPTLRHSRWRALRRRLPGCVLSGAGRASR